MENFKLDDIKKIKPLLKFYFDEINLQTPLSSCAFGQNGNSMVMRIPNDLREQIFGEGKISEHLFSIKKMEKAKAHIFTGENEDYLILRIKKKGDKK